MNTPTPFHDKKQKKKKGLMSGYATGGSRRSKLDSNPDEMITTVDKYPILRSWFSLPSRNKPKPPRHEADHEFQHSENREPDKQVVVVAEVARKSVSHVENNLVSVASFLQVKVLVSDMPGFMQVHAFRSARRTYDSLEKFSQKHMAYNLKREFDKTYGPAWHCIVGSGFGSFVTHSTGCFLYFSMEKLCILLFRTKIQKIVA